MNFYHMNKLSVILSAALVTAALSAVAEPPAATQLPSTNASPAWLTRPLSLVDALNTALLQNAAILKAKNDLEASHGVVVQTRAVALPQLSANGQYENQELTMFRGDPYGKPMHQTWNAGITLSQTIYSGGKLRAALKAATATKQQAIAQYDTTVQDTLLSVRLAYYDVLLAAEQISVHEASVNLLQKELDDQKHRFEAGTVPHFNVLRAEVSLANERPNLIHARNQYRIAKNNLSNLLGYSLPRDIWENIPLNLTDTLDTSPYSVNLPDAIQQALARRTELTSLRRVLELRELDIVNARSGYKPTASVFTGYGAMNSPYATTGNPGDQVDGWNFGAQLQWNIFDGALTQGKVIQAKALAARAKTDLADQSRQIELAVRSAYSDFIEARETLESQLKVQEQADEALREAKARAEAGTATQLDVLDAETSLTQARATQVGAEHDYVAARAKLERAIASDLAPAK